MMKITTYDEAEALVRKYNAEDDEETKFTGDLRAEWELIAQERYPDTETWSNADLRVAFVYGAMAGYSHCSPWGAPPAFDKLQQDAFIDGASTSERQYISDGWCDEDDDDEVIVTSHLEDCYG
jgi:hypothetical protein